MKGLKRIFSSSKGLAAVIAILGIVTVQVLGMAPDVAQTLSISIGSLAGLYIAGTAWEDAGKPKGDEKP